MTEDSMKIYADYNATTPICKASRLSLETVLEHWGNPSSIHTVGRAAKQILEKSRDQVATALGVDSNKVVFTSGGSEANGIVLFGHILQPDISPRILMLPTEHSSVREALPLLKQRNIPVEFIPLDDKGRVDLDKFASQLESFQPTLVCAMWANNETGTLYQADEIAKLCQVSGIYFHCDAVQGFGKVCTTDLAQVSSFSVSAHKIGGPKGVGALVLQTEEPLVRTRFGGSQEIKRRGGTQNMWGIAAFGAACEQIDVQSYQKHTTSFRDQFEKEVMAAVSGVSVPTALGSRLSNTTSLHVGGINANQLVMRLDLEGLCVSSGSACSSGVVKPNEVLMAMGMTAEASQEVIRVSWGKETTQEEVEKAVQIVVESIHKIRESQKKRENK